MATRRASRHNSKGIRHNSIRAADTYRALIHWPDGSSSTFGNHDRARVLAVARAKSTAGATVDFQEHKGWCVYKTTRTFHPDTA